MTMLPLYSSPRNLWAAAKPAAPPPTMTIFSGNPAAGRPRRFLGRAETCFLLVTTTFSPRRSTDQQETALCGRMESFARAEAEAGMMPGTPDSVPNHDPVHERSAVMGAGSVDREELVPVAREEHTFFANMAYEHTSVGKIVSRNSGCQVGTRRAHIRF